MPKDVVASKESLAADGPSQELKQPHPTSRRPNTDGPNQAPRQRDVLLFLLASRLLNALVIKTFFQPDEFFQSLEPAWYLAFGGNAGAWITWEWHHHLRSAIHPSIFALGYRAAHLLAAQLRLPYRTEAQLLLAAPKVVQALIAALGDYYTWKLSEHIYGLGSISSAATLILTVASPWQWFCATRTFSNCLEATLTVIALYNWPWHWSIPSDGEGHFQADAEGLRIREADTPTHGSVDETTRLRRALMLAALATILRPTNILIWLIVSTWTFLRSARLHWLVNVPGTRLSGLVDVAAWSVKPNSFECAVFCREVVLCGSAILALSAIVDRFFYRAWTFPPLNFLHFNVAQSIAIFYGNNNWHYYLSQGYPLLLTTALPFAIVGIYKAFGQAAALKGLPMSSLNAMGGLALISVIVPAVLSMISHKEVRFIYPLLPGLHVLAAQPLASFFSSLLDAPLRRSSDNYLLKRSLLFILLFLNFTIALYTSAIHNSGLITITDYLRNEFEQHYHPNSSSLAYQNAAANMSVGFLMPCHSTPWRSHLHYPPATSHPGIDAWALTCEPPLNLTATEKAGYFDEADQFYADPPFWLKRRMSRHRPSPPISYRGSHSNRRTHEPGVFAAQSARPRRMFEVETHHEERLWRERQGRRPWPEYLVFFEQLEPIMKRAVLRGGGYSECKRIWNSRWHDDWRRRGDVVVWCLYPDRAERKETESTSGEAEASKMKENVKKRAESVVEKPFWKQRPLPDSVKPKQPSLWDRVMGWLGLSSKRGSWWDDGKWS